MKNEPSEQCFWMIDICTNAFSISLEWHRHRLAFPQLCESPLTIPHTPQQTKPNTNIFITLFWLHIIPDWPLQCGSRDRFILSMTDHGVEAVWQSHEKTVGSATHQSNGVFKDTRHERANAWDSSARRTNILKHINDNASDHRVYGPSVGLSSPRDQKAKIYMSDAL